MTNVIDDGAMGTGYTYTIGTGGSSVVALLRDHLAPLLVGRDADEAFDQATTGAGFTTRHHAIDIYGECADCTA